MTQVTHLNILIVGGPNALHNIFIPVNFEICRPSIPNEEHFIHCEIIWKTGLKDKMAVV